jgi:hypothetical protein
MIFVIEKEMEVELEPQLPTNARDTSLRKEILLNQHEIRQSNY